MLNSRNQKVKKIRWQLRLVSMIIIVAQINLMTQTNYDEELVPEYSLPNLFVTNQEDIISTANAWVETRRPEILQQFSEQMFGVVPHHSIVTTFKTTKEVLGAIGGKANLKEIGLMFTNGKNSLEASLLIVLPVNSERAVPIFLGTNFYGNHTIHVDTSISITKHHVNNNESLNIFNNQADYTSRGLRAHRWPVERILERGYGLAVIYYGDIDPDFDDGFQNGIHPLAYSTGQTKPGEDEWGSIGAWAWSLSRIMDYFETDEQVDHNRVAVIGHSRLGKTSLWAGANDARFALVISNDSGCGGAALSKRQFGETIQVINTNFPHWFCGNFKQYNNREPELPFDQHMLLALVAPRPLYVASATEDTWADPLGEYLSLAYASEVYKLFNQDGLDPLYKPSPDQPIWKGKLGYHLRSGKHDLTSYDWEQYLNFADLHLKKD